MNETRCLDDYLCLLVEDAGEGGGVEDGDGLLVVVDLDKGGRGELELLELLLDLLGGLGLDLTESLGDLELSLGDNLLLLGLGGHCFRFLS